MELSAGESLKINRNPSFVSNEFDSVRVDSFDESRDSANFESNIDSNPKPVSSLLGVNEKNRQAYNEQQQYGHRYNTRNA